MTVYINNAFEKLSQRVSGLCAMVIADTKEEAATMLCRHLDEMRIHHNKTIEPEDMISVDTTVKGVIVLNEGDE